MEKSNPKVSIIVPVYNVEKYLHRCMDSLINQTLKDIEIIAVNDGSTDSSLSILREYEKKDTRVIVINKKNGGLSSARNEGMKYTSGDYITFVDSDDWLDINSLEEMYKTSVNYNCDLVMCSYSREYTDKSKPKKFNLEKVTVYNEQECKDLHRRIVGPIGNELGNPEHNDSLVTAWGKLYKSSIIKDNNIEFIDTSIIGTEDCLFNVYAFGNVKKAVFLNESFYKYWKENANSLTAVHKKNLNKRWMTMYAYIREYIDENNLEDYFYTALDNRIAMSILGLGLNECNKDNKISTFKKISNLRNMLKEDTMHNSLNKLDLSKFPAHWRIFYVLNKYKIASLSYLMLNTIEYLRHKI